MENSSKRTPGQFALLALGALGMWARAWVAWRGHRVEDFKRRLEQTTVFNSTWRNR